MASLTGNSIASTYKQLLKVTSEGIGDDASAKYIEDGLGTDSALSISTTRIGVGTNAPDTPLTVRSTTTAQIHLLDGSDATNLGLSLGFDDAGNTTSFISSIYNNDANRFDIRMKGNDTSDAKLTVLGSGNVGIGISPLATFHVKMASDVNFTTSANSSSLRLNAVNDAVDATIPLEINSTNTNFLSNVGIGGAPINQFSIIGDSAIKNINIYTNSDAAVTSDTGARIFTTGDGGTGIYGENGHLVIQGRPAGRSIIFLAGASATEVMKIDSNSRISLSNNDSGFENTIFGKDAGKSIVSGADKNAFFGAFVADATLTNGADFNAGFGYGALSGLTSGSYNTSLGAGSMLTATTATNNVCVGNQSNPSANDSTNQVVIGQGATGQADNSVTLGNSSVGSLYVAPGNTSGQTIFFNSAIQAGWIQYDHGANQMKFASENTINARLNNGSLEPGATDTQDLGSTTRKWDEVHANYVLSQGNQNHVANTMSSPYYRFDGSDDYIVLNEGLDTDHFSFNTKMSISVWVKMDSSSFSTAHAIIGKWHTSGKREYLLYFGDNETLNLTTSSNGSNSTQVSTGALTGLATWNHFTVTYNAGATIIYRNGVSIATGTAESSLFNGAEPLYIGGNQGGTTNDFQGEMSKVQLFNNTLTATEVKELYSGASVPFKYKSANQTDINASFDFTSGWNATTGVNGSATTNNSFTTTATSGQGIHKALLTVGKKYRVVVAGTTQSGQTFEVRNSAGGANTVGSGFGTHEFTATDTSIYLRAETVTGQINISTFTIVQIGAVAEYDGSGIASDKWFDKSGNDLHGTVSGATVENAPSGDDGLIYEEGTWTPTDTSGASLTFGQKSGKYTRIGDTVIAWGFVEYPSTSNSNACKIGNLPFTAGADPISGGSVTYSNSGTVTQAFVRRNSTNTEFYNISGVAVANSGVSVKQIYFNAIYKL